MCATDTINSHLTLFETFKSVVVRVTPPSPEVGPDPAPSEPALDDNCCLVLLHTVTVCLPAGGEIPRIRFQHIRCYLPCGWWHIHTCRSIHLIHVFLGIFNAPNSLEAGYFVYENTEMVLLALQPRRAPSRPGASPPIAVRTSPFCL